MLTSLQTPWEQAVYAVAERARLALGAESHSRIDRAVEIVLAGGVTLQPDGSAVVASQSRPHTGYAVSGGCACKDYATAPMRLCKHKAAVCLMKRALEMAEPDGEKMPASVSTCRPLDGIVTTRPSAQSIAEMTAKMSALSTLPEAPVSVNAYVKVGSHRVQVTLRGHDEMAVLDRLEKILTRYAG